MINRLSLLLLLVSLVSCNATYKAKTKSELAKLCLSEFPFDATPTETKIDTTYIKVKEFIEVDCDTIGKKQVEHECEVKTITIDRIVPDSRQTYLINHLQGQLELKEESLKQLAELHKDELSNKDKQHREENESLVTKYKNETEVIRKESKKYKWIVWLGGGVIGLLLLRKLKVF